MKKSKIEYTWVEFEEDIQTIQFYVKHLKITHLVTLYRGGLPLGVTLSNRCKLPLSIIDYQSYDGNTGNPVLIKNAGIKDNDVVLLIDDIADSGRSIKASLELLEGFNVNVMTLYGNDKHNKEWYYCRPHNKEWVTFPWE